MNLTLVIHCYNNVSASIVALVIYLVVPYFHSVIGISNLLGNEIIGRAIFLADFHDSPNRQNKLHVKFSSYIVNH